MDSAKKFFFAIFFICFGGAVLLNMGLQMLSPALSSPGRGLSLLFPQLSNLGRFGANSGLSDVNFAFIASATGKNSITQGYGATGFSWFGYKDHWHNGIDIAAQYGAPVHSAGPGRIIAVGDQDRFCYRRGFGKFILVADAARNKVLLYAHLGAIKVAAGDTVQAGQVIGTIGMSGYETGTHLHFSVFEGDGFFVANNNGCGQNPVGKDINPIPYLDSVRA